MTARTKRPRDDVVHVRDCGARGDGTALDTAAVQRAIDVCAARAHGGTVVVAPGVYRCGSLALRSGVTLRLEGGAVLQASDTLEHYELDGRRAGLLTAAGAVDVAIEGAGVVDGAARSFFHPERRHFKDDFRRETSRQGAAFLADAEAILHGPWDFDDRPPPVCTLVDCDNVRVEGVTFRDAPAWTFCVLRSRRLLFDRLVIDNNLAVPNSDGIHVSRCRNVRITGCDISGGDDAIAITTLVPDAHRAADAPPERRRTENVTVADCILRSRSAAVRVGYGPYDIRRVALSNLVVHGSNRGIGVFARTGGCIRDVVCSNVVIDTDLVTGHWWGKGEPVHVSAVPGGAGDGAGAPGGIEHVRFAQIVARSPAGCVVYADAPGLVRDVTFDGLDLRLFRSEHERHVGGNLDLRPIGDASRTVYAHDVAGVYLRRVAGFELRGVRVAFDGPAPTWYTRAVHCRRCSEGRVVDLSVRPDDSAAGDSATSGAPRGADVLLESCRRVVVRTDLLAPGAVRCDADCADCRADA
ncbi:MAG: glycoside hydrolase family 28 protein [Planctomycetota bacterium]